MTKKFVTSERKLELQNCCKQNLPETNTVLVVRAKVYTHIASKGCFRKECSNMEICDRGDRPLQA